MNSEFTCGQCRDALPDYVADTLAHTVRPLVERHLDGCDACQHEYAQWRTLADLTHQADAQTPEASVQSTASTW
ncbi:MAG: anti-sigma factor family protein, partial [Ktedonobacterales bacterium]